MFALIAALAALNPDPGEVFNAIEKTKNERLNATASQVFSSNQSPAKAKAEAWIQRPSVSPADVAAHLATGEAFVDYAYLPSSGSLKSGLYAAVIAKRSDGFTVTASLLETDTNLINREVATHIDMMVRNGLRGESAKNAEGLNATLSLGIPRATLIDPLPEIQTATSIVFSPMDVLWGLSFGSLPLNEDSPSRLGRTKKIAYALSASSFVHQLKQTRGAAAGGAAVFTRPQYAVPAESPTDLGRAITADSRGLTADSRGANLDPATIGYVGIGSACDKQPAIPLPEVDGSVEFRASRFTAASLPAGMPGRKVVVLDACAPLFASDPAMSCILVSATKGNEPAMVTFSQIAAVNASPELTVFPYSDVKFGGSLQPDSYVALILSGFLSGAKSVVASQWRAPDESTASILEPTVLKILNAPDESTDVAAEIKINSGRLAARSDSKMQHPYTWARFIVIRG